MVCLFPGNTFLISKQASCFEMPFCSGIQSKWYSPDYRRNRLCASLNMLIALQNYHYCTTKSRVTRNSDDESSAKVHLSKRSERTSDDLCRSAQRAPGQTR